MSAQGKTILVIDDDVDFAFLLKRYLTKNGYTVFTEFTASKAIENLKNNSYDLIISDVRLPDGSGIQLLPQIKSLHYKTPVILITGYSDLKLAVKAMKLGAVDFITKPIQHEELLIKIKDYISVEVTDLKDSSQKTVKSKNTSKHSKYVVGSSEASKNLVHQISLVAPTNFSVLILGESGAGKEYVAKHIHEKSERNQGPFIALDCGALPGEIAGSELFGHMKGAFTGAAKDKQGHFEQANGGTIFLDEVGNLSYENQIKLLRVIQERKVKRLGSSKDIDIDVRIIAATNEDVNLAIKEERFREDLYYRLNEFKVDVLPLRKRVEDIKDFATFFLQKTNEELDKEIRGFEPDVLEIFNKYEWPGNLRELRNIVRRSVLLTRGETVKKDILPLEIQNYSLVSSLSSATKDIYNPSNLKIASAEAEKTAILEALKECKYNKSKAAKLLNIDRKTLYNKLNNYNIDHT